jgi:transposase
MMERQNEPDRLFYEFSFESHLPAQHLLRRIDALLDLSFVRTELASFYSSTGRPSVDPELMIQTPGAQVQELCDNAAEPQLRLYARPFWQA